VRVPIPTLVFLGLFVLLAAQVVRATPAPQPAVAAEATAAAPAPASAAGAGPANPFTMVPPTAEQLAREEALRNLAVAPATARGAVVRAAPSALARAARRAQAPRTSAPPDLSHWGRAAALATKKAQCGECKQPAAWAAGKPRLLAVQEGQRRLYAVLDVQGVEVALPHGGVSPWGRVHIGADRRVHFGVKGCEVDPALLRCPGS
jgi:hypothetical protein